MRGSYENQPENQRVNPRRVSLIECVNVSQEVASVNILHNLFRVHSLLKKEDFFYKKNTFSSATIRNVEQSAIEKKNFNKPQDIMLQILQN